MLACLLKKADKIQANFTFLNILFWQLISSIQTG
jgi:hypothetical protein